MFRQVAVLTIGVVLMTSWPAGAQYFGRNKVRYEDFDFRVLQTPHFDVYHYPAAEAAVRYGAQLAEQWYAHLSQVLQHEFRERQPLVLYASHTHFTQNTIVPGFVPEGVGGVTEHQKGRVVMPFAAGLGETRHVLGHELVHAFQRDILRAHRRSLALLPLWFVEGMAEYLTIGRVDANTAMWLRDAAWNNRLPTIAELDDPRWFPYRYGQALWAFLAERFGAQVVARSLVSTAPGGALGRLVSVTGVDAATLTREWHAAIRSAAGPAPGRTGGASPRRIAHGAAGAPRDRDAVITRSNGGGRINVGAALSPDGRQLVFLSERDQYSIDVYLADAASGRITRRLVQTAGDAHFDSLQYIGSAGAGSPRGDRFAMAAIHRGQPVLTILEMPSGDVAHEIVLPAMDEVFSPSWSPDGRRLAFSALTGGFSDLYIVDLESETVRPLTTDAFADLQPAWSPDGRTIAFATDRFSSSLERLEFGRYTLGALDVDTGALRPLPALAGSKHISPQWSPDAASLYFVADADGRSNIYRLHVASGDLFRVTDVGTGISGITALSPVLSVAHDARRMAFSVYRRGAYELRVTHLADGEALAPPARGPLVAAVDAADDGGGGPGMWDRRGAGAEAFTVRPYTRRLSLDGIGQPYLSAGGGGAMGGFFRAGVSFSFGDMLGEHALRTTLQVGRRAADFGAQVAYLNRQSRWNWAIVGEQVGSVLGATRSHVRRADGGAADEVLREDVRVTQIHRGVSGVAIYPFDRARRFELGGGLHTVSFARDTATALYSAVTGDLLGETREQVDAARPLRLIQTSAALVHDTAVLGPTSPVLGQRYRLELAPTFGDVAFTTAVADYRRYLMPVRPLTLALRVKHTGRYGRGGRDGRLMPLFYNLRDMVRGYGTRETSAHLCRRSADPSSCPAVALLGTTHVLMANSELRVPILGAFTGRASYGPLPMEGFVFADGAWLWRQGPGSSAGHRLDWQRTLLRSVGGGIRLGVRGFVFEVAGARALDVRQGWRLAFNFGPGF